MSIKSHLTTWLLLLALVTGIDSARAGDPAGDTRSTPPTETICWQHPTARKDGTPFTVDEIKQYEVEHRVGDIVVRHTLEGPQTEFTANITTFGIQCFSVRVFDLDYTPSDWVPELCFARLAPPATVKLEKCAG